jgi:hypothetical protein
MLFKQILMGIVFFYGFHTAFAGQIFITDYSSDATAKVYVTNT